MSQQTQRKNKVFHGLRRSSKDFNQQDDETHGSRRSIHNSSFRRGLRRTEEEWLAKNRVAPLPTRQVRGLRKNRRSPSSQASQLRPGAELGDHVLVAEPEIVVAPEHMVEPDVVVEPEVVVDPCIEPDIVVDPELPTRDNEDDHFLVEAQPITEIFAVAQAKEVNPEELQRKLHKQAKEQQCRIIGYVIISISFLAIIISAIFATTRSFTPNENWAQNNNTRPTNTTPSSASPSPLNDFVLSLPNYTQQSLKRPLSPQSKALAWLLDHPKLPSLMDWKKKQLFALGTLYFSLDGEVWPKNIRDNWLTYEKDECYWFSSDFGHFDPNGKYLLDLRYDVPPCNGHFQFQSLVLGQLEQVLLMQTIPPEISMLSHLQILAIAYSNITTNMQNFLPTELSQLSELQIINFMENSMTGTIPTELGLATSLSGLDLSTNAFSGKIPSSLGQLTQMDRLFLSDNFFTGPLPTEVGHCTSLTVLNVFNNTLTGSLPTELGLLTSVSAMDLGRNAFSGSLPSSLGSMAGLRSFYVHFNSLSGPLPTQVGLLTGLKRLGFYFNSFLGPLPTQVGLLTGLKGLGFYFNSFSGPLPTQVGMLTGLTSMGLWANQFTGTLPSEVGKLSSLTTLSFRSNFFTGTLPTELGHITNTTLLSLRDNALSGVLPSEIAMSTSLGVIWGFGNSLTGPLPTEMGFLTTMTDLRLHANALTGMLPSQLGLLTALTRLQVNSNALTSSIPTELGNLESIGDLQIFSISENLVSGIVPTSLCHLDSYNQKYDVGLSFDCQEDFLCGCCWCPCLGSTSAVDHTEACVAAVPRMWPGLFPTPGNSTHTVAINIFSDEYAEEISWEWSRKLQNGIWEILNSTYLWEPLSLHSYKMDVSSSALYRLRMRSVHSDGFCCTYGLGWATITTVIASKDHANGSLIWDGLGNFESHLDVFVSVDESGVAQNIAAEDHSR